MESITKNRQSLDTLRAMVARAYGPGAVPGGDDFAEELGHGWFNVAYAITLAGGRRVVLKIAPPAGVRVMTYEHQMMRIELAALDLIRAQTAVPVEDDDDVETLHERIKVAERRMLVDAVGRMAREGFTINDRKVRFT